MATETEIMNVFKNVFGIQKRKIMKILKICFRGRHFWKLSPALDLKCGHFEKVSPALNSDTLPHQTEQLTKSKVEEMINK